MHVVHSTGPVSISRLVVAPALAALCRCAAFMNLGFLVLYVVVCICLHGQEHMNVMAFRRLSFGGFSNLFRERAWPIFITCLSVSIIAVILAGSNRVA